MSHAKLARTVLEPAIYAHRAAQGGGSGIDVVASVHGGTRLCWLVEGKMLSDVHFLPQGLDVKVFAARTSCSTKEMLQTVHAWAKQEPRGYQRLMDALFSAASATASASDIDTYVASTAAQCAYLEQLGNKSGAPIVPAWLHELAISAHRDKVAIHPSGAGGGDIVLCIGRSEACEQWKERIEGAGLESLDVHIHAQGVHSDPARDPERDPETIAR
jgi:phosphomevalonate kinase